MKEAAALPYNFGRPVRAWGHRACLSRNFGVRPVPVAPPALTSPPWRLRSLGVESPAHPAWLRLRRASRSARNYCSQKAVRNREGSGGRCRKGTSGSLGCPVSGESGSPRAPGGGGGL